MALWRFGRSWPAATMRAYLEELRERKANFDLPPEQMTEANGWTVDGTDAPIGVEPPGPPLPDGLFAQAKQALIGYHFSDRRVVIGHFDPRVPLEGRDMLLEIKVLGLHYLNGVRVSAVRDESDGHRTSFGFRYDTLEGHIERGYEWFLLSKNHESGQIRFRIQAHWQLGQFPNWWSRVGFWLIGAHLRERWRRHAVAHLRGLARRRVAATGAGAGELPPAAAQAASLAVGHVAQAGKPGGGAAGLEAHDDVLADGEPGKDAACRRSRGEPCGSVG